MAFQRLIQSNLDRAYRAVGDLAETISIAAETAGTYSFATSSYTEGTASPAIQVRALLQESSKQADEGSISPSVTMTIPSHTITVSLDEYTRVTRPNANVYDIVSWSDDGFTTTIVMRRDTR